VAEPAPTELGKAKGREEGKRSSAARARRVERGRRSRGSLSIWGLGSRLLRGRGADSGRVTLQSASPVLLFLWKRAHDGEGAYPALKRWEGQMWRSVLIVTRDSIKEDGINGRSQASGVGMASRVSGVEILRCCCSRLT
jgi:hypothetical protein